MLSKTQKVGIKLLNYIVNSLSSIKKVTVQVAVFTYLMVCEKNVYQNSINIGEIVTQDSHLHNLFIINGIIRQNSLGLLRPANPKPAAAILVVIGMILSKS